MGQSHVLCLFLLMAGMCYSQESVTGRPKPNIPVLTTTAYEVDDRKPLSKTAIEVIDLTCGKSHFCNTTIGENDHSSCYNCNYKCKCDPTCHMYGDCCVDIVPIEQPKHSQQSQFVCQSQYPKKNDDRKTPSPNILMLSKCPEVGSVHPEIRSKCESPNVTDYLQATPVTHPDTHIIYRNVYCAKCFGVKSFKSWTYKIKCDVGSLAEKASNKDELWRSILKDPKCIVTNSPPSGTSESIRQCLSNVVGTCNATGNWRNYNSVTEDLCSRFYLPVEHVEDSRTYRNVFCAMCNGATVDPRKRCFSFERSFVVPRIRPHSFSQPLSVLIDFNPDPEEEISTETPEKRTLCGEGELFDPLSGSCHPLRCSQRRLLTGGVCKPLYRSSQGLGYSTSLAIRPGDGLTVDNTAEIATLYAKKLNKAVESFKPFSWTKLTFAPYVKKNSLKRSISQLRAIKLQGTLVSTAESTIHAMEEALRDLGQLILSFPLPNINVSLNTQHLPCEERENELLDGELIPEETVIFYSVPVFQTCSGSECLSGVDFLPVYGILNCPHIEVNLSQTNATYDQRDMSLLLDNVTVFLNTSNHFYCGDVLKMCADSVLRLQELLDLSKNTTDKLPDDDVDESYLIMTVLSVVCISLSLLCLLLTFLLYCFVTQLRTLPGQNTMALIFYLFISQLIFQVGIQLTWNTTLCRTMGILIHYFWLTTFAWMAICAYHMCAVFSNLASSRFSNKSEERKTLLKYVVLSNLYAAIFVVTCVVYHVTTSDGTSVGYGDSICFITQPSDIGIFFAGPLALVLVFNVVCFIKTVLSIRNVPNMNSSKNKPDKNHMHVYFRLSILLGFTWIFGFVAAVFRTDALWYVFIILNGLQGVFIFVAYCINKRTLRLIRNRLSQKRPIKYSRPSKTSSSERRTHSTTI